MSLRREQGTTRPPAPPPPSHDSPSLPHAIELAPVISYPVEHVNAHAGLPEAAPPAHEAPAMLAEAATSMAGHVTEAPQSASLTRLTPAPS